MKVEIKRGRVVSFDRATQVVRIRLDDDQVSRGGDIELHSSSYYGVGTELAPAEGDAVEVILNGNQSGSTPLSARTIRYKSAVSTAEH